MIMNKTFSMYAVFLIIFGSMFVFGSEMTALYAFAEQQSVTEESSHRFNSLWISIIGDVLLAIIFVTIFLYLVRIMNKKHIDLMSLIRTSLGDTKDILLEEKKMRDRLKQYARQAFKNDCGALLLCFGMLHKFSTSDNDDWIHNPDVDKMLVKSRKIFGRMRNTINLSISTIDPVLLDEIEKFLIDSEDLIDDVHKISVKYDGIKKKIMYLADRLSTDIDETV